MQTGIQALIESGTISESGAEVLREILKYKPNILLIGNRGTGKTFVIKRILEHYYNCNVGLVRAFKHEYSDVRANCKFFDFDTLDEALNSPLKIDIIICDTHSIDFNMLKNVKQQLIFETSATNIERILHYLGKDVFKVVIKTSIKKDSSGFNKHIISTIKLYNPSVGLYMAVYRHFDDYVDRDLIKKVFEFKPKVTL